MIFEKNIWISNVNINENSKTFIIAEAGVNHNGDLETAKRLVDAAVEAGVDAVKFQTFKTDKLILNNIEKAPYQKKTTNAVENQAEMLKKLEITKEQNRELINYCKKKNIIFLYKKAFRAIFFLRSLSRVQKNRFDKYTIFTSSC